MVIYFNYLCVLCEELSVLSGLPFNTKFTRNFSTRTQRRNKGII